MSYGLCVLIEGNSTYYYLGVLITRANRGHLIAGARTSVLVAEGRTSVLVEGTRTSTTIAEASLQILSH